LRDESDKVIETAISGVINSSKMKQLKGGRMLWRNGQEPDGSHLNLENH
jgi:hypothetical protein